MADPTDSPAEEGIPTPPPPPAPPPKKRGFGAVWLVLGGVIAAGAGFGLSKVVPGGWPIADTSALEAQVQALAADNAALKKQLEDLAAKAPAGDLDARVAALESRPLPEDLSALKSQVQTLASAPGGAGEAEAIKALQDQIAALAAKTETATDPAAMNAAIEAATAAAVKSAEDQLAATVASAKESAARLKTEAALTRISAALDSGAPYAAALADLAPLQVPPVLADHGDTGLPTLQGLRESFPDAARAALEAARKADMDGSWTQRIAAFLQDQTGARSLTPRDGNDPDAILSRAEAALGTGDLTTALGELAALPDPAKAALADWQAKAQLRLDAGAALADLAKSGG